VGLPPQRHSNLLIAHTTKIAGIVPPRRRTGDNSRRFDGPPVFLRFSLGIYSNSLGEDRRITEAMPNPDAFEVSQTRHLRAAASQSKCLEKAVETTDFADGTDAGGLKIRSGSPAG
jgi:hypothetical protein